jgi:hypothetical protein
MSVSGDGPDPVLSDETRDALVGELFALGQAVNPGSGRCFCGSDGDLIDAVTDMRARADRELGDDR